MDGNINWEDDDAEKKRIAVVSIDGVEVNASGHVDQLQRQYSLLSVCGLALTIDNAWVALGGSITVAIANGGPPGLLYELLIACFYYSFIAASIAELASAIPSSGGVYHWSSLHPNWGRVIGFFAGSLNFFGWIFDQAAIVQISANVAVQMYAIFHPDLTIQAWHVYVAFLIITWLCCFLVVFANRFLPLLNQIGLFLVIVGGLVTIIVVAAMPQQHASSAFVWKDWTNSTGWNGGIAFLLGVLNGAFTIGTTDAITHLAEELPDPKHDLPKAVAAQMILGTVTAFCYAVAILYAISDLDAVLDSNGSFPLAAVYAQATGNKGGTFGLLLIVLLSIIICVVSAFLTVSRTWWSLARDNATPFSAFFGRVNVRLSCPVEATVLAALLTSAFGAIAVGSRTAFVDLAGSFIILTTSSYLLAILPHLLSGRRHTPQGPFWMGKAGFAVNAIAVLLIVFFNVMFCFPYAMPTTADSMNYNSVILVGVLALTGIWWAVHGVRKYKGPRLTALYIDGVVVTRPEEVLAKVE